MRACLPKEASPIFAVVKTQLNLNEPGFSYWTIILIKVEYFNAV